MAKNTKLKLEVDESGEDIKKVTKEVAEELAKIGIQNNDNSPTKASKKTTVELNEMLIDMVASMEGVSVVKKCDSCFVETNVPLNASVHILVPGGHVYEIEIED